MVSIIFLSVVFLFSQSFTAYNRFDFIKSNDNNKNTVLRTINSKAFKPGEVLKYRLHYGFVDAGTATLQVDKCDRTIDGRTIYHIIGTGKTRGAFDWFFKVRDRYETYIDAQGVFPWLFIRRVNEGGYIINQDYKFFQREQKVNTDKGKTYNVPKNIQDMLSAFYYARTIDFSHANKGDIFTINAFVDSKVYPLKIKYMGKSTAKVNGVKYRCIKFHPVVQKGRIFKDEDDLNVWITDDKNKIPVLAQAKVLVGSIKMELADYKNLANPVSIVK